MIPIKHAGGAPERLVVVCLSNAANLLGIVLGIPN